MVDHPVSSQKTRHRAEREETVRWTVLVKEPAGVRAIKEKGFVEILIIFSYYRIL
jgi:hypothetical protein